jgi:hypothetical protein
MHRRPQCSAETRARLGLRGFLDEFCSGDLVAIEALRRLDGMHQVLIGSEKTDEVLGQAKGEEALQQLLQEMQRGALMGQSGG